MVLDNSASHSSQILIGQLKWKPSESCLKEVKKLSQTITKLCPSGNSMKWSTVRKQSTENTILGKLVR